MAKTLLYAPRRLCLIRSPSLYSPFCKAPIRRKNSGLHGLINMEPVPPLLPKPAGFVSQTRIYCTSLLQWAAALLPHRLIKPAILPSELSMGGRLCRLSSRRSMAACWSLAARQSPSMDLIRISPIFSTNKRCIT